MDEELFFRRVFAARTHSAQASQESRSPLIHMHDWHLPARHFCAHTLNNSELLETLDMFAAYSQGSTRREEQ